MDWPDAGFYGKRSPQEPPKLFVELFPIARWKSFFFKFFILTPFFVRHTDRRQALGNKMDHMNDSTRIYRGEKKNYFSSDDTIATTTTTTTNRWHDRDDDENRMRRPTGKRTELVTGARTRISDAEFMSAPPHATRNSYTCATVWHARNANRPRPWWGSGGKFCKKLKGSKGSKGPRDRISPILRVMISSDLPDRCNERTKPGKVHYPL